MPECHLGSKQEGAWYWVLGNCWQLCSRVIGKIRYLVIHVVEVYGRILLNDMQGNASCLQPSSSKWKVGSSYLLEAQHICVEPAPWDKITSPLWARFSHRQESVLHESGRQMLEWRKQQYRKTIYISATAWLVKIRRGRQLYLIDFSTSFTLIASWSWHCIFMGDASSVVLSHASGSRGLCMVNFSPRYVSACSRLTALNVDKNTKSRRCSGFNFQGVTFCIPVTTLMDKRHKPPDTEIRAEKSQIINSSSESQKSSKCCILLYITE